MLTRITCIRWFVKLRNCYFKKSDSRRGKFLPHLLRNLRVWLPSGFFEQIRKGESPARVTRGVHVWGAQTNIRKSVFAPPTIPWATWAKNHALYKNSNFPRMKTWSGRRSHVPTGFNHDTKNSQGVLNTGYVTSCARAWIMPLRNPRVGKDEGGMRRWRKGPPGNPELMLADVAQKNQSLWV